MLHGIAYCGECGNKMSVQYKKGNKYQCNALKQRRGGPVCQIIPGDPIDAVVTKAFFEAVSPIELDAYEKALEKQRELSEKIDNAHKQQIQRLQYSEKLARRQYDKSDPDNRLVTSELEKRWENALWELKKAEDEYAKRKQTQQTATLSPEIKKLFTNIGKKLPEIWKTDLLDKPKKKELLRAIIDKVVMHRVIQDKVQLRVIWRGGANTNFQIPVKVGHFKHLSSAKEMEKIIISMHKEGKSDEEVAEYLTNLGYRSPRKDFVLVTTVRTVRLRHGLMKNPNMSTPRNIEGYLTVTQISKAIEVPNYWIHGRINNGTIKIEKNFKTGLYLFPNTSHTIKKFGKLKNGKVKKLRFS